MDECGSFTPCHVRTKLLFEISSTIHSRVAENEKNPLWTSGEVEVDAERRKKMNVHQQRIRTMTHTKISWNCKHPCLTDPSKVLILLGVSSQVLGGELETQICLG